MANNIMQRGRAKSPGVVNKIKYVDRLMSHHSFNRRRGRRSRSVVNRFVLGHYPKRAKSPGLINKIKYVNRLTSDHSFNRRRGQRSQSVVNTFLLRHYPMKEGQKYWIYQ
jgi:hypothetical protein